ncbi:rhodanese-related sulfurtransferase [Methylorubrum extorquens]|nr:rhodanese-related sulfurtransferase [Methylorubrum extorquens]
MTTKSAKDLVTEANREVDPLLADEALARLSQPDTVLVEMREGEEAAGSGKIAGAVHVPRSPALEKAGTLAERE